MQTGNQGGAAGADAAGATDEPYAPRSGSFKVLVYSRARGYGHSSIAAGEAMLQRIAAEQGFEAVVTSTNELITAEGLAPFELVYFNNTSGDVFNEAEQAAYEEWMTARHGAFAGHHSATDTESTWSFYAEVTGQYFTGIVPGLVYDSISFEAGAQGHPAVAGLPNPWPWTTEEWFRFDSHLEWSAKPGFQVLGRKLSDGQPAVWVREWGNFRAFYTSLGHDKKTFEDPAFVRHVTGGIMWAVRREHLIVD